MSLVRMQDCKEPTWEPSRSLNRSLNGCIPAQINSVVGSVEITLLDSFRSIPKSSKCFRKIPTKRPAVTWHPPNLRYEAIPRTGGRSPRILRDLGGPGRVRTGDLIHAMDARSQLRHRPTWGRYRDSNPSNESHSLVSCRWTIPTTSKVPGRSTAELPAPEGTGVDLNHRPPGSWS